jgi:tetratricopeptide (TPR) repeat protein
MNPNTDWTSPLAILAAGLVLGVMVIFLNKRKPGLLSNIPWRGFVTGVVTTLAAVGIVYYAQKSSTPRTPPADDLDARIEIARKAIEQNNLQAVYEQTQYVLARRPNDSRALTYEALVLMSMGDTAAAGKLLEKALKSDPDFLDAYVTTAWVQTQEGRTDAAEQTIREALRRHPGEKAKLDKVFAQMKAHPPAAKSQPASASTPIQVTLEAERKGPGVVFVIARPAGMPSGHPIAVRRIEGDALPAIFDFGDADSMTGEPLPSAIRLEARLDSDGDVTTKNPADPFAMQDGVVAGTAVKLTLR